MLSKDIFVPLTICIDQTRRALVIVLPCYGALEIVGVIIIIILLSCVVAGVDTWYWKTRSWHTCGLRTAQWVMCCWWTETSAFELVSRQLVSATDFSSRTCRGLINSFTSFLITARGSRDSVVFGIVAKFFSLRWYNSWTAALGLMKFCMNMYF